MWSRSVELLSTDCKIYNTTGHSHREATTVWVVKTFPPFTEEKCSLPYSLEHPTRLMWLKIMTYINTYYVWLKPFFSNTSCLVFSHVTLSKHVPSRNNKSIINASLLNLKVAFKEATFFPPWIFSSPVENVCSESSGLKNDWLIFATRQRPASIQTAPQLSDVASAWPDNTRREKSRAKEPQQIPWYYDLVLFK